MAMKTLSIDFGEKNVGVAISDDKGIIAAPHSVLQRESDSQIISAVKDLVQQQKIKQVVIGIPRSIYDQPTERETRCRNFMAKLQDKLSPKTPVKEWDETFSTKAVTNKKKDIDAKAAAIILQEFLDSQNK